MSVILAESNIVCKSSSTSFSSNKSDVIPKILQDLQKIEEKINWEKLRNHSTTQRVFFPPNKNVYHYPELL